MTLLSFKIVGCLKTMKIKTSFPRRWMIFIAIWLCNVNLVTEQRNIYVPFTFRFVVFRLTDVLMQLWGPISMLFTRGALTP